MPQMAPMSWMIIYFYFTIIMLMFIMKMYFNKFTFTKTAINLSMNNHEKIWKW